MLVILWQDLARWDVKTARAAAFRRAHPTFRPLGNFIEEATELVRPWEDPKRDWPVYGVTNSEGVFLSHHQKGATFNAPYKRIRKDWFFHNPTRANVGSLGRVPDVPAGAITSPEYQVWRIRDGFTPDYVAILIQLPFFIDLIQWHRVGAVKERLFTQNLMEIPVPVAKEETQRGIVEKWRRLQESTAEVHGRIERLKAECEATFFSDLGLKQPEDKTRPKYMSVSWQQLERWSVSYNQAVLVGCDLSHGKFSVRSLGSLLEFVQYGTSEKATENGPGTKILRINNIKDRVLNRRPLGYEFRQILQRH
jgi:hypothetical protein